MKLTVIAPLLTFAVLALSCSPAVAAAGPGCLPTPLPSGPGSNPSVSMNVRYAPDELRVTFWRQQCQDTGDIVLLLRAVPISASSLLCSSRWYLDQGLSRFDVSFPSVIAPPTEGPGASFCDTISGPITVIVAASTLAAGEPGTFDATDDFTLLYFGKSDDGTHYVVYRLEIPSPTSTPTPTPLPPSLPIIAAVATRCNPCRSGQVVAFQTNVINSGPPILVEYKGGARMPDGTILSLVNRLTTLPTGPSTLPLVPEQTLPAGLPTMDLLIEAAILEPALGVTVSRHNVVLHLLP